MKIFCTGVIAFLAFAGCKTLESATVSNPLTEACAPSTTVNEMLAVYNQRQDTPRSWGHYDPFLVDTVLSGPAPQAQPGACLFLIHERRLTASHHSRETPRWLTPMFGYFFATAPQADSPGADLFPLAAQPAGIAQWLRAQGVERAVLVPTELTNSAMPFGLAVRMYMALHEGFHVHAQSPTWFRLAGMHTQPWPLWDLQPDRRQLAAQCYRDTEALKIEQAALFRAVEILESGAVPEHVCSLINTFAVQRRARWQAAGNAPFDCEKAEAIMELEEGIPQWVAWSAQESAGLFSHTELLQRLAGQASEPFYPLGAMQLLLLNQLSAKPLEIPNNIAASATPEAGGLFGQLLQVCAHEVSTTR